MVIETLDRSPPAFFRPGPSAFAKLAFFSALALFLMVADARFALTEPLRAALAIVLDPFERVARVPIDAWRTVGEYLGGLDRALAAEEAARRQLARQAERALRVEQLERENTRLRGLLELRPTLAVRSLTAEVLYEAPDAYSRKVIVDRGASHGVIAGSPVINEIGVLGQVTRVYPLASEATLLTDKDAAIPVINTRTQARSAALGRPGGAGMELRFMAGNADVQVGDLLATSGIDGVYPPGLPVARVTSVERRVDTSFARVGLQPVAAPDGVRHVLLLEPQGRPPALPAGPAADAAKKGASR
jgi:rod shape-determining protein MreC